LAWALTLAAAAGLGAAGGAAGYQLGGADRPAALPSNPSADAAPPASQPTSAPATEPAETGGAARSPSPASSSPTPPPLAGRVVALDPGHSPSGGSTRPVPNGRGGTKACNTSGTSTDAGYPEHEFNYDVALRVRALLEAQGAAVHLSRDDDPAAVTCVDQRGTFADAVGAEVLVSIHADGNADRSVKGFFAIVSEPPLNQAQGAPSLELAEAVLARLRAAGLTQNAAYPGGISRRGDIAGVAFATVPVAMFELGEMRNPEEAALMSSPDGRQRYAEAVAAGIADWLAANP
jgi:N-acetylmuramoyl-L-alanine amidase